MNPILVGLFILVSLLRLGSLAVSIRNEKALKADGAVEYGVTHSRVVAIAFTLYYALTFIEAFWRGAQPTGWTTFGVVLYVLSMIALLLVWRELGRFWTVKLIIASDHQLNRGILYRWVRHPNYFLNVIPELIGLALIMGAWRVLAIGLPIWFIILVIRIIQEERVIKEHFPDGITLTFPSRNVAL